MTPALLSAVLSKLMWERVRGRGPRAYSRVRQSKLLAVDRRSYFNQFAFDKLINIRFLPISNPETNRLMIGTYSDSATTH